MRLGILFLIILIGCGGSAAISAQDINDTSNPYTVFNNDEVEDTVYQIVIDSSYSNQKKIMIEESLYSWSEASGGEFIYSIEFADSVPESGYHVISIKNADPGGGFDGFCSYQRENGEKRTSFALITVKDNLTDKRFKPVMLHEIGHSLWLSHYEGIQKSIMDPATSQTNEIECVDVQQLCEIWDCTFVCRSDVNEKASTSRQPGLEKAN